MRTYIRHILAFLLPIVCLLAGTEVLLRQIPNDYAFKAERMINDGREFEFLVLGSSHAYRGVDPDQMDRKGFNAANISQDLSYDRAILERYIASMPQLKDLFIPISYGSLTSELEQGPEAWRAKNYILYMDLPGRSFQLSDHFELMNGPLREHVQRLKAYLLAGKDNRVCAFSGSSQKQVDPDIDLVADGLKAAKRHSHPGRSTESAEGHLRAIIDLAVDRGIRVHLFIPPAWKTYREHLDPKQLATVRKVCQHYADSVPSVTYHDLLADQQFIEADFADADHLSASGQVKLSRILSNW
jgi:hypothetical protein